MKTRIASAGALALLALAGSHGTVAAKDGPVAAPRITPAPTIAVDGRLSKYHLHVPNIYDIGFPRLTLHVTGSGFSPLSKVSIAVMNTSTWTVLARGSTYAGDAVVATICPGDPRHQGCTKPNPAAGTIDFRLRLDSPPLASNVEVLYRSGSQSGSHGVTLR